MLVASVGICAFDVLVHSFVEVTLLDFGRITKVRIQKLLNVEGVQCCAPCKPKFVPFATLIFNLEIFNNEDSSLCFDLAVAV